MNRNSIAKNAAIVVAIVGSLAADAVNDAIAADAQLNNDKPPSRPNIVLIMADDFGYECLGCNGGLSYKTPNLDRLSRSGVRFTHCYSQPLCTPSRVQIMTGKYNFRNYKSFEYLDPNEKTFARILSDNGYRTCIAGKWQLNGRAAKKPGADNSQRPLQLGFDRTCLWQVTSLPPRYQNPGLEVDGNRPTVFDGKYGPDVCADFVCDFIQANKEKPFLVYYPMILTHSPFVPTPDHPNWGQSKVDKDRKYFADMVEYTDKIVGRIESSLKKAGVYDNTLLIFTGDNGSPRGIRTKTSNGEIVGGKGTTRRAGNHVPLVVGFPSAAKPASVCNDLVDFTDMLPTLLSAAAVPPEDIKTDGQSFLPQIRGQKGSPRKWAYFHYYPRHGNASRHRGRFAQTQQYKLYHDGRVYDFAKDPLEQNPLGDKLPAHAKPEIEMLQNVIAKFDRQGAAADAKDAERLFEKRRRNRK